MGDLKKKNYLQQNKLTINGQWQNYAFFINFT